MAELKDRLRQLRKERKLTQQDIASYLGITESAYGFYEQGRNEPSLSALRMLAKKFEVPIGYLTGEEDERPSTDAADKDEKYDSFAVISQMIQEFGFEDFGFFDIETWKNLSPEDIDEIRRHFRWIAQQAKERNENDPV